MPEVTEHMTCREVVELVTDYLESALPADETSVFEQHLNLCEGCVTYIHQMRITVETVGRVGVEDIAAETRDKLLAAFRDWKRA
jgi:hypothetical protein